MLFINCARITTKRFPHYTIIYSHSIGNNVQVAYLTRIYKVELHIRENICNTGNLV